MVSFDWVAVGLFCMLVLWLARQHSWEGRPFCSRNFQSAGTRHRVAMGAIACAERRCVATHSPVLRRGRCAWGSHVRGRLAVIASMSLLPAFIIDLYGTNLECIPEFDWAHGYLWA